MGMSQAVLLSITQTVFSITILILEEWLFNLNLTFYFILYLNSDPAKHLNRAKLGPVIISNTSMFTHGPFASFILYK